MAVQPDENGEWPNLDEWPTVTADITCRTPGCPVEGVTYRVPMPESVDGVYRAACVQCNTPNDDIVVIPEAGVSGA
jgi:hypothetical protein